MGELLATMLNVLGKVGLASATDASFREADKKYQKTESVQPTIDDFFSQVEEDDDFLISLASQGGINNFSILDHVDKYNDSSTNVNPGASSSKSNLPPQRNTLDNYLTNIPISRKEKDNQNQKEIEDDIDEFGDWDWLSQEADLQEGQNKRRKLH